MSRQLQEYIRSKRHHAYRKPVEELAPDYSEKKWTPIERMTDRFERLCDAQTPVILPGEQICFLRTTANLPDIFTEEEWAELRSRHFIHELGYLSNLSPDYEGAIASGLLAGREAADGYGRRAIDAILRLTDRYRDQAIKDNRPDIAAVLERVPRYGARSLREALQSFPSKT